MAQRFHEQSEDRNLSFFLSRIGHHSPRYSREGQVTKAKVVSAPRETARVGLALFFFLFVHALTAFALLRRLPISFFFERVSVCLLTPGAYMDGERGVERGREGEMKGRSRRYEVVLTRWACSRATREREGVRARERSWRYSSSFVNFSLWLSPARSRR